MKIWALRFTLMDDDSAEVGMEGIQLFDSKDKAIGEFEDDEIVENHPRMSELVRLLEADGIVDIDNQVTVTLEEMDVK